MYYHNIGADLWLCEHVCLCVFCGYGKYLGPYSKIKGMRINAEPGFVDDVPVCDQLVDGEKVSIPWLHYF